MAVEYNFLLTSRANHRAPHLLILTKNERTGRYSWSYHTIIGKIKDPKPKASGTDVRYAAGAEGEFDLYVNGSLYGTLTLNNNKSIRTLNIGDPAVFVSFTGTTDDAQFTGVSR